MRAWTIYLERDGVRNEIDTVFFNELCDANYVKRSLVGHDGYDPAIEVCGAGLVICRACEETVSEDDKVCPHCGARLDLPETTYPHSFK